MSMTTNIRQTSVEHNIAIVLKRQSSVEAHTSFGTKRKLVMSKSANEMTSENVTMKRHNVKRQNSTGSISSVTTRKHDSVETPTTSMASVRRKDSYTVRTDRRNPDILTCRVCQFQMTINSQRLFEIQERLEKLLTEKKVLNSKIVAESFRNFQAQVIKIRNRQPADIKPAIRRLESSLKSEGAYKNVKSGFEGIKLEITEVVDRSEYVTDKPSTILTSPTKVPVKSRDSSQTNSPQASKKPIPRATTVTLSQQKDRGKRHAMPSIQRPVIKEEASSLSPRTTQTKTPALETKDKDGRVVNHQDILSLNKTISKLFSHLAIDKPGVTDPAAAKGQQPPKTQQKTTSSSQAISVAGKVQKGSSKRDVDDIQELINKLKLFEHELQRKRTVEHDEIQTLQSELQKLKSQLKDQHGQLQRIRGTHMIANKAKGKHVELLEERHMTEKKDIEEKLQALEKNIKRNLEVTRENDQIEETKQELYKLKLEIEKLHRLADPTVTAHDEFASRKGRTRLRISDDDPSYEIGEMLHKMAVIRNEMQGLRDSKAALQRHVKELDGWESRFGDIEKELETFHHDALSDLSAMERESDLTGGNDGIRRQLAQEPSSTSPPSKTKLKKLHTLYLNKRRKLEDTEKSLRQSHQELDLTKARLLKLIDSVDRVYSDSSAFPDTSFSPRDRGRGGMELSSLSDKSEQDDESKLFDIAMVRVNDFAVRTKKYESQLKEFQKSDKVLTDVVMETEELCRYLQVAVKDSDEAGVKVKSNLTECRIALRKLKDQDSERLRGIEELRKDSNKLMAEVHKLYLFTDYGIESLESQEDTETDSPDKRHVSKFHEATKQLVVIHERFNVIRSMKAALQIALNDLEKHASSSQSDAKDQMMKLNMQITVREQELKDQHSEVKRLRDEADHDKTEISRLQLEVNDRFKSTLSVADEEKVYLRNKIDDVQRRLDIAEKNLNEAMKEKYNLLTRLSVMAGARLTDDNPAILDLSDPFRPTKLAEMFSGLYDDEWTNAYETLINQFSLEETEAIQQLLSVVMRSFTFCDVTAWSQMTDLHRVLFMLHQSESSPAKLEEKTQLLSAEDRKQIRDIRKWCAPQAADTVVQLFINGDTDTKWTKQQVDACEPYINKCVTLSWLMNVQSPPVHMANEVESGDPFDGNKHKHYTNTGTVVDFVVWPTLHLTKQGAVLSKGVVQTRRQQE
ncbi:hyaluronan mediated motility receptor-like isoform X3 [Pecten maximus]|uniref:hyaluronan mediated motility receptor-like isoform X3 n=1 Tax=Pecten maximus TaxID=6579 RepID=UPI001458FBBF|nr:hyaluronan mediated motility receptor-like isoform X3 [Pecten maximus]